MASSSSISNRKGTGAIVAYRGAGAGRGRAVLPSSGSFDRQEGARRLENVRVPVLVLSAANDPLGTAQGVAEVFARVKNPNIGVVMLKGGGHMGFPALSADYYYSMMLDFFDPRTGPGRK